MARQKTDYRKNEADINKTITFIKKKKLQNNVLRKMINSINTPSELQSNNSKTMKDIKGSTNKQ
jgi:hypothetical protein